MADEDSVLIDTTPEVQEVHAPGKKSLSAIFSEVTLNSNVQD